MPKPYSMDLRERAIAAFEGGTSHEEVAETFEIGESTLRRWRARKRETGSVAPAPHGGGRLPGIPVPKRGALLVLVTEKPDRTLEELVAELERRQRIRISVSGMSRTLKKMGLSRKKNADGDRAARSTRAGAAKALREGDRRNRPEASRVP